LSRRLTLAVVVLLGSMADAADAAADPIAQADAGSAAVGSAADAAPSDAAPSDAAPADAARSDAAPSDAAGSAAGSAAAPATGSATPASATPATGPASGSDDMGDQAIGGQIGFAIGGSVTPGGLHIAGHYLYKLTVHDWFDSVAAFSFGGNAAACFHDRSDALVCTHGLLDGDAIELTGEVRHVFPDQGRYRPFAMAGIGIAVVHFDGDSLTGVAIPLHAGGGLRLTIATDVALVAQAEVTLGIAILNRGYGAAPQLGAQVTAGAEVRLR
jgi:hypothetical protein